MAGPVVTRAQLSTVGFDALAATERLPTMDPGRGASCRATHRDLLHTRLPTTVPLAGARPDAIAVASARSAAHVAAAADLAAELGSLLLALCSKESDARQVAELAARRPGLQWAAVQLPDGYEHELLTFRTSQLSDAHVVRLGDLSLKRNLVLLLARLAGWSSVLFLDDDIDGIDPDAVRVSAAALGPLAMIGFEVADFPDNSVVCHAHRLAHGPQETFVSGSALLVDTSRPIPFFPQVYNEDWFFLLHRVAEGAVGRHGRVHQLPYQPFANPQRAAGEEFGEVLAEGMMHLLHGHPTASDMMTAAGDPAFWKGFLARRKNFIDQITSRLDPLDRDPIRALHAAKARHDEITPDSCAAYMADWRADSARWSEYLPVPAGRMSLRSATDRLGLTPYTSSSETRAAAGKARVMTTEVKVDPAARVAETAQIGAPYRALQCGEWERLDRPTVIAAGCDIGHFCVIGEEAQLGARTILDVYCHVEGGATIGPGVLVTHRGTVGAKSRVGAGAVIAGLICERSQVGEGSRVFGDLVHRQLDPTLPWDAPEAEETSPRLGRNVFVGWGATVIGGVNIGDGVYICAGATVTKDVEAHHIVTATNQVVPVQEWKGALRKSEFFEGNRTTVG